MRFLGNRLACHQEKETWIDCLCHMKTFIEWKREEADDSSCFVVGFPLYPVTIALQVFVVEMFFMNLLLILRCHWWSLKTTSKHWTLDITGFLNQFIFFFWEKKKFKRKKWSLDVLNRNLQHLSSKQNWLIQPIFRKESLPWHRLSKSEEKIEHVFYLTSKKIKFIFTFKI